MQIGIRVGFEFNPTYPLLPLRCTVPVILVMLLRNFFTVAEDGCKVLGVLT